jgi:hypothetical protein
VDYTQSNIVQVNLSWILDDKSWKIHNLLLFCRCSYHEATHH